MQILPNIKIIDLALYLEKEKTLIIADLHLGYEEMLNMAGVLVPRFQYEKIIKHLNFIFSKCGVEKIIIAGDLKHGFGKITKQEWGETLKFLDYLCEKTKNIILIKGNHDIILAPIADKKNIKIYENYYFKKEKIYITHGHKIPDDLNLSEAETVIIGHEHPAVSLRDETRTEKIKCFLKGKFQDKNLIVIPSFNFLTEGTDIISERTLSPFLSKQRNIAISNHLFLNQHLGNFEVYAIEKMKVLYFGMLKNLSD